MILRVAAFAIALAATTVIRGQDSTAPPTPGLPFYLEGVDLTKPSQGAFRGWPPSPVLERLYPLPWRWPSFQRAGLLGQPVAFVMWVPWNRFSQRLVTETLSDRNVRRALNANWLTVIVNADRRPDLRERYQSGAWPVVTLLLPNGKPMLSQANPTGQALPITMGFVKPDALLFALNEGRLYYDRRGNVLYGVAEVFEKRMSDLAPEAAPLRAEASDQMARWLLGNVDAKNGGFGTAPKYVVGGIVEYAALREARFQPALVKPARDALEKLTSGPLWDTREGGVRRMAAAPDWGEIQLEKMLDGNAELLRETVFALRQQDSPGLRAALSGTARFLTTGLARPGGGFHNARLAPAEPAQPAAIDPLVLAGPNAMAGAALLRAAAIENDESLAKAGREAIELVLARGWSSGRGANHVIEPSPEPYRFLTTQADVAFGLIDAYESTGEPRYLAAARDVADFAWNNLRSGDEFALRDHLPVEPDLGMLTSPKWPMPENVRLARVFVRLHHHGAGEAYRSRGASIVGSFGRDCTAYRVHGVDPALALEELVRSPLIVTIEGHVSDPASAALRRAALNVAHPWTIVRTAAPAEGRGPAAVLARGTIQRRVEDPAALAAGAAAVVREGDEGGEGGEEKP